MIEIDNIYNMDCLEGMKMIPDNSIDCIICDLPYGTMKGADINGWKRRGDMCQWDEIIPTDKLFEQYARILKKAGACILFSQEPYTSHLRTFNPRNMDFCYPMIWKKDITGNPLNAKKAPMSMFEDINVFRRANPLHDFDCAHPLRPYFAKVYEYIGKTKKELIDTFGTCVDHTFRFNSSQFSLCTEPTYNGLIEHYGIDKMDGFMDFASLREIDDSFEVKKEYEPTFNLPEGKQSMSNILDFKKDTDTFHPTQKPLDLLRYLVLTYSNEGDTILDNTCGSGTTCVAAYKEHRHYIGFELNKEYYDKALQRINRERQQLTLF